jgi:hypothetical protein
MSVNVSNYGTNESGSTQSVPSVCPYFQVDQISPHTFSIEELKNFAGSQTYEPRPGGRNAGTTEPKKIYYTVDDRGFKKSDDPVQVGYLPAAIKMFNFARMHEEEFPKQCYVEWGTVPFFGEDFIVKMVIHENLVEKLLNVMITPPPPKEYHMLKGNKASSKEVQFVSLTKQLKKYGYQKNQQTFDPSGQAIKCGIFLADSNNTTLLCFSFFKEVWNGQAYRGLRGAGTGPVEQILYDPLSCVPTAGAAPALVPPTTPKRKWTRSTASCSTSAPVGTPPTVQKRPRTGIRQVEVEQVKKVDSIYDGQHLDTMDMKFVIPDSSDLHSAALGSDTCAEFREDDICMSQMDDIQNARLYWSIDTNFFDDLVNDF